MSVFVLDKRKKPLMPCSEKRARLLLDRGRAVVHKIRPFTIRLKDRTVENSVLQPMQIKLDPGSKTTGIAVIREDGEGAEKQTVVMLAELQHRGDQIRDSLTQRRAFRRRRRNRNLRHRAARFDNRTRREGWLPPSLHHRLDTTMVWVNRLCRLAPVTAIATEPVRFDMQALDNPEISGIEYQQGTLFGYEVREYLLEKWQRRCAYCDADKVPLESEHIQPKSRGGSDRVNNLTLSCRCCNKAKGHQPVAIFLKAQPERLKKILAQAKRPRNDAAAVNATRWALFNALNATGLPVTASSGGRTKYNRTHMDLPKTHALDAASVGHVTDIRAWQVPTLVIKATGRGSYQRTRLDRHGFPRGHLMREKRIHGFQTGDLVKAQVLNGKKAGSYQGRVAIRKSGSFNIQTLEGAIQGISHRHCRIMQRADGYGYFFKPRLTEVEKRAA